MLYEGTLTKLRQQHQPGISLCVRTSDDRRALEVLAKIGVVGAAAADGLSLPFMLDDAVANINRQLIHAGIDIDAIGARGHDLESIYLGMVGGAP